MAGTDPAIAQMDFDHDGLGIATERGDVIGAWACFHIPDILVEVDWMEGHEMSDEAVAKVVWAFARHGIALHIDRGEMGGGTNLIHSADDTITFERRAGYRNDFGDYFDNHFSQNKRGIFHYALMAHYVTSGGDQVGGVANGPYPGHFTVADGRWSDIETGSVFMHELGHTIGLHSRNFDGIDSHRYSFSQYPSVMNYNAPNDYYDYSSGPDSSTNYNDWGHLNLGEYLV